MKVNLQKIVQSLMEVGINQHKIAAAIGVKQPTISHIYRSVWGTKKPSYTTADALIKFAAKHGIREDGSKDAKVHKRGSWKAMPPPPSTNKVVEERA